MGLQIPAQAVAVISAIAIDRSGRVFEKLRGYRNILLIGSRHAYAAHQT